MDINLTKRLAFLGCLSLVVVGGCREAEQPSASPNQTVAGAITKSDSVELLIDFGDRSAWRFRADAAGLETVADLMAAAAEHPRAPQIEMSGSGLTAFVASIGELDTSAGQGWTFYVNDKWSENGIGVKKIAPGDRVKWTYGRWEENPSANAE